MFLNLHHCGSSPEGTTRFQKEWPCPRLALLQLFLSSLLVWKAKSSVKRLWNRRASKPCTCESSSAMEQCAKPIMKGVMQQKSYHVRECTAWGDSTPCYCLAKLLLCLTRKSWLFSLHESTGRYSSSTTLLKRELTNVNASDWKTSLFLSHNFPQL